MIRANITALPTPNEEPELLPSVPGLVWEIEIESGNACTGTIC